jgi:PAS domain S-box-containing protein
MGEALRRYELLAAHTRDVILFVRREDGAILEANAAAVRTYGYPRDELLGLRIGDLRAPDTRQETALQMAEADATGIVFETAHLRKDGTRFPVEVSSEGALLGGERVLVSVVRDITERKRAEAALRESDERKSEFLAVLSHELRNPLAPILNGLEAMRRADLSPATAARVRDIVERQARHLVRLVDDLLDVTRIARGKIELQRTVLDLRELARRVADDHRSVFERAGVALHVELPAAPAWVDADPTRIAQALGNLLLNAAKFTPAGGATRVSLDAGAAAVELRVRDDGAGIAPELLPRLFEPFAQGDRTLARTGGGLGLGLALVKGLVEQHGGKVSARSEGCGRGAELTISLPPSPPPATPAAGAARARRGASALVLLVEDNPDAAESLAEVLRLDGHRVEIAADGRSGVELARRLVPDVILCDVGLPDLFGYDVARALRAEPALAGTLLVAVSGYAQRQDRERAREAGFDVHLPKPPPLDALSALIAQRTGGPDGASLRATPR